MKDSTLERLMMIKCNSKVPIINSEGKGSTKQVITDTQYMTDHLMVRPWPLALRYSNILFEVIKDTQYMTDHLMVRPWPLALRHSNILF